MATTNSIIEAIFVVGFHHEKGNEVEWFFPTDTPIMTRTEPTFQMLRNDLAYLSIPDQAHKSERDFCYFKIGSYFAVSCFQQIATCNLKERIDGDTRGSVQKSVCVLSTRPFFGAIRSILEPCTQVYFNQGTFSDTQILVHLYEKLTQRFNVNKPCFDSDILYFGLSLQSLVTKWRRNLLTLFKLFLLERKVVFYGIPVGDVCQTVLGIVSLVPLLLSHSETNSKPDDSLQLNDSVSLSQPSNTNSNNNINLTNESNLSSFQKKNNLSSFQKKNNIQTNDSEQHSNSNSNSLEIHLRQFGLPLELQQTTFISPYQSLPQLDFLNRQSSFFIGTSNALFTKENKILQCDVVVDVTNGTIEFLNKSLHKELTLTPMDKAYIDHIITVVEHHLKQNIDNHSLFQVWEGSNDWIREMFANYLKCFLSSFVDADFGTSKPLNDWNNGWVRTWSKTQNCLRWMANVNPHIVYQQTPLHPGLSYQKSILSQVTNRISKVNNALTPLKQHLKDHMKKISNVIDEITSPENPNSENTHNVKLQNNNDNNQSNDTVKEISSNESSNSDFTQKTLGLNSTKDSSEEHNQIGSFFSRLSQKVNAFLFVNKQTQTEVKEDKSQNSNTSKATNSMTDSSPSATNTNLLPSASNNTTTTSHTVEDTNSSLNNDTSFTLMY